MGFYYGCISSSDVTWNRVLDFAPCKSYEDLDVLIHLPFVVDDVADPLTFLPSSVVIVSD